VLLEGRTALVTGASRGIGAAIAAAFAREGARLVLGGRSTQVEAVADGIRKQGGSAVAVRGDLRDEASAKALVGACRKELGGLDVLVNNAGLMVAARLGMASAESIREHFDVNVYATIALTQYAIRLMDAKRSPSIVNMASIAGTQGMADLAVYSASKGAVVAFTLASAKELAPKGIRVNAIAPGFIDTDLVRGITPAERQRRIDGIAMGRAGTAEEVAGAALFLASDLSRYVTGQVLGVDGGMQA